MSRYQRIVFHSGILFTFFVASCLLAQSGQEYRRSAIMRGNLVKTVFGNWGVVGQPADKGNRGAWIYDNNGYIGDVSPLVGAEVTVGTKTFHSVVVCPVARPTRRREESDIGKQWAFEPEAGYFNESQESVALYSDPDSWPPQWPDKMNDPEDPGWSGSWNGFFGKTTTASEECFYVMDDNNDEEFNTANNNIWNVDFKPDSTNPFRNGLGLEVKVRGMQWADFLAQDAIFWLYEITNTSTTDYSKVVFGMLVGTLVGESSSRLFNEYDDDYSFFNVEEDITYTGDYDDNASRNPLWTGDVGVVGYAFLESPGNQFDGIDNDGDAEANPLFAPTGPYFEESDFQPRKISVGDKVVLIDGDYNRTVVTVQAGDTDFSTRGRTRTQSYKVTVIPGQTELVEGNIIVVDGVDAVNPNAFDGIDNDLDGLIDENYYIHYRQHREDQNGNVLIDKLSPVRHIDYVSGLGLHDPLIDEKRDDGLDNDGDWNEEFDDVGADGLVGTNDNGEGDGEPTPGEPNFDQTDVDESDQIGLTSFEYFVPSNDFSMADDEDLWNRLSPGHFEVPTSIVNNKPTRGEDGDFFYGSGYFPLRAGETQRFSLALVYGDGGGPNMDIADLLVNRETVQKIYDSDYRFPPAPEKPTIRVVPGDGKVTIYWDRKAERSFDPVLKKYDFEGYKIYRATDHNFNDVFKITDADGTIISYEPLAQFDLDNDISGYFHANGDLYQQGRGASFYMGDNSGLEHHYVDKDVENGRRYFYAVVAYDQGDEIADIFPKENDKRIDVLSSGEVKTFQNTAMAIPNAPVEGYAPPEGSEQIASLHQTGTGKVYYKVVNEQNLTGHQYRLEFLDTSNDGVDNNGNWNPATDDVGSDGIANTEDADGTESNGRPDPGEPNLDLKDPQEYFVPITTLYSVRDLTGDSEEFESKDTLSVRLANKNLIEGTIEIKNRNNQTVPESKYTLDPVNGKIKGKYSGALGYGETYTITYQYYPVYRSAYMERSPWTDETLDTDIFDGLYLSFNNHWNVSRDSANTGWSDSTRAYPFDLTIIDTYFGSDHLLGLRHPADYRIEFADGIIDTSYAIPEMFVKGIPVNFKIYNITDSLYIDYVFNDNDHSGGLSRLDEVIFLEKGNDGGNIYTWDLLIKKGSKDTLYTYHGGDTLFLSQKKPFRTGDFFEFETGLPEIRQDVSESDMDKIRVVPNPYVVATSHELPLPSSITSGRGERKIDFIHLPAGAKIHIFTSRGEHITTLYHDSDMFDGSVSWNLKTKENLDVAAGIYFYVVEASIGKKAGKIAIIK